MDALHYKARIAKFLHAFRFLDKEIDNKNGTKSKKNTIKTSQLTQKQLIELFNKYKNMKKVQMEYRLTLCFYY